MEKYQICPAEPCNIGDIERLLVIIHDVHRNLRPDIFTSGEEVKYTADELAILLTRSDCFLRVARIAEKTVGYAIGFFIHKDGNRVSDPADYLYIDDLCVDPDYRSLGIGNALLHAMEDVAKEKGLKSLRLNVYAGNPAERFYSNVGYKPLSYTLEKKVD